MSRYERYGTRDQAYSQWQRALPHDELTWIDLDCLQYCWKCGVILHLIELAQDVGQAFKATTVLRQLAKQSDISASLVFYAKDANETITQFRKQALYPQRGSMEVLTPEAFERWLLELRTCHPVPCESCNGTGQGFRQDYDIVHKVDIEVHEPCRDCDGTGKRGFHYSCQR